MLCSWISSLNSILYLYILSGSISYLYMCIQFLYCSFYYFVVTKQLMPYEYCVLTCGLKVGITGNDVQSQSYACINNGVKHTRKGFVQGAYTASNTQRQPDCSLQLCIIYKDSQHGLLPRGPPLGKISTFNVQDIIYISGGHALIFRHANPLPTTEKYSLVWPDRFSPFFFGLAFKKYTL